MRYAPRHRSPHLLETFALTDIILNLFIFFFITFSLAYIPKTKEIQTAVSVELPRAGAGQTREAQGPVLVSLKADDPEGVFLGEQRYALEAFAAALAALPAERLARGVVVRCDREVSIERTLQTLDALTQAGIRNVSVATEPARP